MLKMWQLTQPKLNCYISKTFKVHDLQTVWDFYFIFLKEEVYTLDPA